MAFELFVFEPICWRLSQKRVACTLIDIYDCITPKRGILLSLQTRPLSISYFVCISHYIYCLVSETVIDNSLDNPTYTPTTIMFFRHFNQRWRNGSSFYCIRKLDKWLYMQRYIAESAKYSTNSLSKLLTSFLISVKTGSPSYCNTSHLPLTHYSNSKLKDSSKELDL